MPQNAATNEQCSNELVALFDMTVTAVDSQR